MNCGPDVNLFDALRQELVTRGRVALICSSVEQDIATFSIAARDAATGQLGVAVASKFLAVGAYVPFVRAGVGAVATQARTNLHYGPQVLELLSNGVGPAQCSERVRSRDSLSERRQLGIVAVSGESHTFTGASCTRWAGGVAGTDFAIQGNILTGAEVIRAMQAAWLESELAFPERLLAVLDAGEAAGGDSRGRQAAALIVAGDGLGPHGRLDLRVDDAAQPVSSLERLLAQWREQA